MKIDTKKAQQTLDTLDDFEKGMLEIEIKHNNKTSDKLINFLMYKLPNSDFSNNIIYCKSGFGHFSIDCNTMEVINENQKIKEMIENRIYN